MCWQEVILKINIDILFISFFVLSYNLPILLDTLYTCGCIIIQQAQTNTLHPLIWLHTQLPNDVTNDSRVIVHYSTVATLVARGTDE